MMNIQDENLFKRPTLQELLNVTTMSLFVRAMSGPFLRKITKQT